ncbi:MAG: hypothetical protein LBJ61_00255 [Deltaproteobacteria bacterium]|jgi:hypothetical protein|nr:hypothetical protein [Deltaproteobacteria bacterium]
MLSGAINENRTLKDIMKDASPLQMVDWFMSMAVVPPENWRKKAAVECLPFLSAGLGMLEEAGLGRDELRGAIEFLREATDRAEALLEAMAFRNKVDAGQVKVLGDVTYKNYFTGRGAGLGRH